MTALLAWPLQESVVATLKGDATLMQMIVGVFDEVPKDIDPPYLTVGDDTENIDDAQGIRMGDHTLTIHAWSEYGGRKEVKEIGGRVYQLLHEPTPNLAVNGGDVVFSRWEFGDSFRDPDGVTWHGVQRFRFMVQET